MYRNIFLLILLASFASTATADNESNWTMAYDIPDSSPLQPLLKVTGKKALDADSDSPDLVGNAVLVGPDLVLTCGHVWGGEDIENNFEGKKGFAFNYASTSEGEFTEPDIYLAEEVIFSLEDDFTGIDIALVRTEGEPGSKYGWASIAEWPNTQDSVPLTNIVNDYYGHDKAANQNCSGIANNPDNGLGFAETVVWAQCDDGGEKKYSGSGSGFFNEAGELAAIRCGTFNQMAQLAIELAEAKGIDLSIESSSGTAAQTLTISQDRTERDINGNGVIYQRALEAMEIDPTGVFSGVPINERMNVAVFVKLDLVSTGGPVTNIQWTVPGNAIKDTEIISNTATGAGYRTQCEEVILLPSDLQQSSIQFLWKDTGSRTVTLNATVGGTPLVATKNFEVRRNPKAEIFWATGFGSNPSSDPGQVPDNILSEHRWWHTIEPVVPAGEFFRFHRGYIQKANCFRAIFGYEPVKVYMTAPNYLPEDTPTYTSQHLGSVGGGSGIVIEPRHPIPGAIYTMPDRFTLAGDGTTKLEDYSHENALAADIIGYHNAHHSLLCSSGDFLWVRVTPADPIFHRFHWMLTKVHELWQLTQLGKPGGGITVPADTPLGATVYYPETAMEVPATPAEGTVQFCTPASGSFFLTGTTYVNCTLKDVEMLNPDPNAPVLGGSIQSITFPVTVTPQGSLNAGPVDVYFLVDLSGSFHDDLPLFKSEVAGTGGVIDDLLAVNPDFKFGVGSYEDYPISPFGWTSDAAYRRDIDLTPNAGNVKATINGLSLRFGGDLPEGQLPALYQAASGVGQVVPGHPQADIPANQNANFDDFRNGQPVKKIFLLWTDADFHNPGDAGTIPYPGPTFQQTVDAVLALDPPKVLGLSSGGGGLEDLRKMARMTGALATSTGCDCNDDGRIDIKPGEPLVCVIPDSGEGVGAAIKGLLLAATGARTCDEIAIDVFDAFCLSTNKLTTSVRELKENYKAIARGLVAATPIINDGTGASRSTNENDECLIRIAAVLDSVIGYEDEQESSEPEPAPEPEPEPEWADTGHMTLDGRLATGGHNQLYALEVDYLDIDANNNYVYALMTLASHLQNGEISTGQMRWLYERAIMSAVPIDIIAQYMGFDHRTANLDDHMIGSGGDSIARVLLYDVTQMIINGDLYDENPKSRRTYDALVDQAAQQLGISGEVSAQIRDTVDEELALLGNKKETFWAEIPYAPPIVIDTTPDEEWTTGGGHMTVDGRLVVGGHSQLYALDVDWLGIDANSNYVYALMTLVSYLQDGEIPPGQMGWLKERAYMSAVPRDIIEEYMAFEHRTANLEDHVVGSGGDSIARVLLYDVTQMITHGDLYDKNPRSRSAYHGLLSKAAEQLGVPEDVSREIQRFVDQEVYLFHKKKAVFWSETPYVPPNTVVVPPDDDDTPPGTVVLPPGTIDMPPDDIDVPPNTVIVPPDDVVTNLGNNLPVIDKVTLTPNPYRKEPGAPCDSPIEASATASDADGDAVTVSYQWFVNGFMVHGLVGSVLAPSNFVDRDIVKCVGIPYDGTDYGFSVSESVNVVCPLPDHHLFGPGPQQPPDNVDEPPHDHDDPYADDDDDHDHEHGDHGDDHDDDTDHDDDDDHGDHDDDDDGVEDVNDNSPLDPTEDTDTDDDGTGDNADLDDDNDGVLDSVDAFPLDPTEWEDTDDDGIGNNADPDDDGDGSLDDVDFDDDNPNVCSDDDYDTCDDCSSGTYDPSNDGLDTDGDGVCDTGDPDDDDDGVEDIFDAFPRDGTEWEDTDDDGIGDNADPDDDNDGVLDSGDDNDGVFDIDIDIDDDNDYLIDIDDWEVGDVDDLIDLGDFNSTDPIDLGDLELDEIYYYDLSGVVILDLLAPDTPIINSD